MATGTAGLGQDDSSKNSSIEILRQISRQSSDCSNSAVAEEVELLSHVYLEDMTVMRSDGEFALQFHITPSTADDKDRQFVYLDLSILLTKGYPLSRPKISGGQSRGLSEPHVRSIMEGLLYKLEEHLGSPMIYELIEYAKDCLTDNNRPGGECVICQFPFKETDEFVRTECYHYFHSSCFARYWQFCIREQEDGGYCKGEEEKQKKGLAPPIPECPLCREPMLSTVSSSSSPPSSPSEASAVGRAEEKEEQEEKEEETFETFCPSASLKEWQSKMAELLKKQREKGGVINPAREDNVIDELWTWNQRKTTTKDDESSLNKVEVVEILEKQDALCHTRRRTKAKPRSATNDGSRTASSASAQRTSSSSSQQQQPRATSRDQAGFQRRKQYGKHHRKQHGTGATDMDGISSGTLEELVAGFVETGHDRTAEKSVDRASRHEVSRQEEKTMERVSRQEQEEEKKGSRCEKSKENTHATCSRHEEKLTEKVSREEGDAAPAKCKSNGRWRGSGRPDSSSGRGEREARKWNREQQHEGDWRQHTRGPRSYYYGEPRKHHHQRSAGRYHHDHRQPRDGVRWIEGEPTPAARTAQGCNHHSSAGVKHSSSSSSGSPKVQRHFTAHDREGATMSAHKHSHSMRALHEEQERCASQASAAAAAAKPHHHDTRGRGDGAPPPPPPGFKRIPESVLATGASRNHLKEPPGLEKQLRNSTC